MSHSISSSCCFQCLRFWRSALVGFKSVCMNVSDYLSSKGRVDKSYEDLIVLIWMTDDARDIHTLLSELQ